MRHHRPVTASLLTAFATACVAGSLAACGGDSTGPGGAGQVGVAFRPATASPSSTALALAGDGTPVVGASPTQATTPAGLVIARGTDTIVVTRAQFVVREVELERVNADCDDDDDDRRSNDRSHDDDCAELEIGPFLVDVPVTGATAGVLSVDIPEGTYDEVEFEIKKVSSSNDGDRAFRQAHPDFRDISLRIEGRYNGMPFVFVSAAEAEVELPLGAPLVVGRDGDRLTVSLDMGTWFVNPAGGLFNPAQANTGGRVRERVQKSIKASFRALSDDRDDD